MTFIFFRQVGIPPTSMNLCPFEILMLDHGRKIVHVLEERIRWVLPCCFQHATGLNLGSLWIHLQLRFKSSRPYASIGPYRPQKSFVSMFETRIFPMVKSPSIGGPFSAMLKTNKKTYRILKVTQNIFFGERYPMKYPYKTVGWEMFPY